MLVVTLSCFGVWGKLQYDWYCKLSLAAKWVEALVKLEPLAQEMPAANDWGLSPYVPLPPAPPKISSQQELELLELAVTRLSIAKQRMCGLRILVETRKAEVFPILRKLLRQSRHSEIIAALVHLISLQRNPADARELVRLLDHQDPAVRAAAGDALGYIHLPTYLHSREDFWLEQHQNSLNVEPPIKIESLLPSGGGQPRNPIELDPQVRVRLEQLMLTGATDVERTAAAGALVNWPPVDCKWRFAEWGVWIDDGGDLKLVKSLLDEIPSFVHQTGNPLKEFKNRVNRIMFIDKPVVHITANRSMAIDLEVLIRQGRPWYAYPRPDDFTFESGTLYGHYRKNDNGSLEEELPEIRTLATLDPPNLTALAPLAEGYTWRLPKHRSVGSASGGMGAMQNEFASAGLRWQSLIVSTNREAWMIPPDVGRDPKFNWWKELRDVPSSWVSSHGETERFLYYDGPSLSQSPVIPCSDATQLAIVTQPMITPQWHFYVERGTHKGNRAARTGFLVQVRNDGIAVQDFAIPGNAGEAVEVQLSSKPISAQNAIDTFLALLIKAGLTKEEAGGLIASWRKQFFETSGKRLLTILSREDYDEICPLRIRPQPTESARVGIVLTELAE